ncbi:glycerate kinase type-2 family protein, partial [Porticoccus sp.]
WRGTSAIAIMTLLQKLTHIAMPEFDPRQLLIDLFHTAVATADPAQVLPPFLASEPLSGNRPLIVIGAGKAACAMAAALEQHWPGPLRGLVVTAYGHSEPLQRIEVIEASHPVPDTNSELAARRMLALVDNLTAADQVICLISGGGSSLLALPAPGLCLADKQQLNRALLKSGADIHEMNCVRKHLSAIKGGRLAAACAPARLLTLAISDVPGDDPAVIASGPTVADPSTSSQARAILDKYDIELSDAMTPWLQSAASETPKPGDPALAQGQFRLIATPAQSLAAAAERAEAAGLAVLSLGDALTGEARELARQHAQLALSISRGKGSVQPPCVILSGGETSVTVRGNGKGGRNGEYLLALADTLQGAAGIYALAADTDGIDGAGDNAGALLSPDSWQRGRQLGWDTATQLANNDCYPYFDALGDLLICGPTRTNVNDFRAILVLPESASG